MDTDYTDGYGLGLYCVIREICVQNFLSPPEGRYQGVIKGSGLRLTFLEQAEIV